MYEARKVANFLLANYDARAFDLSNLRVNKLLFFMHDWALVEEPNGLVRNHFEAWKLGPVVRSVYDAFKRYGDGPILGPADYIDYATGRPRPIAFEEIKRRHQEMITTAFDAYAHYPPRALSSCHTNQAARGASSSKPHQPTSYRILGSPMI
jgi:uncharacterized phage-associated protein